MKNVVIIFSACLLCFTTAKAQSSKDNPYYSRTEKARLNVSNKEWKKILPADVYRIAREEGTERPFTGKYYDEHTKGKYYCAVCGNLLFDSEAKFESGTGWPSFYQPVSKDRVTVKTDRSHGMVRKEVECARCGSHLGHVFNDGPEPTGLRYCMNSAVLELEPAKK